MKLQFTSTKFHKYELYTYIFINCNLCKHLKSNMTCKMSTRPMTTWTLESGFCPSFEGNQKSYKKL